MNHVQLGATGLDVSVVGFGGIPITRLGESDAAALVRQAVDGGINFIDTAWGYPGSEQRIGRAIADIDRASLVIATKDGSADGAMFTRHVEESLQRLGVAVVDLIQLHNVSDRDKWEAVEAPGGAYEAAVHLRDEGKVRHIGVTSHDVRLAAELIETGRFETLQLPLNFVADEGLPVVARCRELGVGFIGMKPFGGGAITDGELALRFLGQFPSVVPIPGIETADELRQILDIVANPRPLTDAERARIETIKAALGKVFCRACGYCQPCPQGIAISMIMRAESFARRMPVEQTRRAFRRHMAKVDDCTECGACVEKCPYDLNIPARLPEMRRWYEAWRTEHPE